MATSLDYIDYCIGQLHDLGTITAKRMFGECMIYINAKPVLLVCDNTPYIKIHPSVEALLHTHPKGLPYPGAKEHYILDLDDRDLVREVIQAIEPFLSVPKKKKPAR